MAHGSPTFEEAARVVPIGSHDYQATIHREWSYGPAAHGGFLVALLYSAVGKHFRSTLATYLLFDTAAIHVEFLRPVTVGSCTIAIKDTRLGKGSATVHATLLQGGKECVVAYATNINRTTKGISMPIKPKLEPRIPPINFADVLANKDPHWIRYHIPFAREAPNNALSHVLFAMMKEPETDPNIMQQWLTCADPGERWTTNKLGLTVDYFVPALENFYADAPNNAKTMAKRAMRWAEHGQTWEESQWSAPRWYPTLNMSLDIKRALPPEGVDWLFTRMTTLDVTDGRHDVHATVWDEHGNLVAVSQQLWLVVDIERSVIAKARLEAQKAASKL